MRAEISSTFNLSWKLTASSYTFSVHIRDDEYADEGATRKPLLCHDTTCLTRNVIRYSPGSRPSFFSTQYPSLYLCVTLFSSITQYTRERVHLTARTQQTISRLVILFSLIQCCPVLPNGLWPSLHSALDTCSNFLLNYFNFSNI